MKVYICQCDLLWCDKDGNRAHIEKLLSKAGESGRAEGTADVRWSAGIEAGGLIVMPEMFSTGFITMPAGEAESDGASLSWMKVISKRYGCAVAGSVATEAIDGALKGKMATAVAGNDGKSRFYNRFYFVKPDGTFVKYDKRHLFSFAGENKRFTAGKDRTVVEYNGVRFLLQVCYDLRFPIFSRNILPNLYDAAIYVASWPMTRIGAWDSLLKARAIENQCYVIGVNRVGKDPSCQYNGHSAIVDPYGNIAASCAEGAEGIASADIDMSFLKAFRKKFPVLEDADLLP